MRAIAWSVVASLILPMPSFAQRAGGSPSPSVSTRSYSPPSVSSRSNTISSGSAARLGGTTGGGGGGYRPAPVRSTLSTPSGSSLSINDPSHPLHILNPLNPMSPLSPLNPINQMNLADDEGTEIFKKVLKVENDAGTLKAYQCLLHRDEFNKSNPMEQNCVLLGVITRERVEALAGTKKMCSEMSGEEKLLIGILAVTLGAGIATGALVAADLGGSYFIERWALGAFGVATAVSAAAMYYVDRGWCAEAVGSVVRRFYDELNQRVPPNYARLQPVDGVVWTALDHVIKN